MLIPDNISKFNSNGEKLLYFRFKNDSAASSIYVLHSVFTNYHLKNVSGELDFLVLAPGMGIFAIEVKHGRVSRKHGVWEFTNNKGETTRKAISPFAQVTSTMHSIRNYILEKVKEDSKKYDRLSKILWGTGVAFTSMDNPPDVGQEAESWQILTKDGLRLRISNYIDSLAKGFHNRFEGRPWYDSNSARPSNSDCELIIQIIRGDFETDYSDLNRIRDTNELIDEFTKEQFHLLDITNYNDRCLFEGGAGTGKTLLAIELLKRQSETGLKVGLFCYNKNLGEYLYASAKKLFLIPVYIGSLHSYLLQKTNIESSDYSHQFFSEELPFEFLMQNEDFSEDEKLDFLIVDEAQDLITTYYIEIFDHILKGGLKDGKWVFFGDFSNQAIFINSTRDKLLALLKDKADFVNYPPLKVNCRNTKVIARQNTLISGAEYPEFLHGGIDGKPVVQKFPVNDSYKECIEMLIEELSKSFVPLDEVVLLAPKKFNNTSISESDFIKRSIKKGLNFFTVQAFKGLEKNVVIVFDFNDLLSFESRQLLYVALSRAKQLLYIVMDINLKDEYYQLIQENYKKVN
jgi:hypothetical protein